MLRHLKIVNFALIDNLELEFGSGLHILTGETGAGKSIILDAIDAVLGGKVASRAVRSGADRAIIEATFEADQELANWLVQEKLAGEDHPLKTFVCSREISSKANRSRVNGTLVNKQQMQYLRDQLLEITAQGQTLLLSQASKQREWLDNFAGEQLKIVKERVRNLFFTVAETRNLLQKKQQQEREKLQQLDLWQYQLKELQEADITDPHELENLQQEYQKLSHSADLQQKSYQLYEILYQNQQEIACADLLGKSEMILREMVSFDPELKSIYELVNTALAYVEEAGRAINSYGMSIEADPDRLAYLETRIRKLKQLCRKYGASLAEVIAYQHKLEQELLGLESDNLSLEVLTAKLAEEEQALLSACQELTQIRQATARNLEVKLTEILKSLALEKVRFHIEITTHPPTPEGIDHICFLFSANPGEELQPLSEIASGGEMSRFLLGLKSCHGDNARLLIFDEIDVGVSGKVAQAIAKQLWLLSRGRQVLCVTHQPIIAAVADQHFHVSKTTTGEKTTVQVKLLGLAERKQELAQIASGLQGTESAIAFAETLLMQAQNLKQHDQSRSQPTTSATPSTGRKGTKRTRAGRQSG
ncbi:MAG: DNA repair protein RecN [Pseudanabaenaceae cyanobacterium]